MSSSSQCACPNPNPASVIFDEAPKEIQVAPPRYLKVEAAAGSLDEPGVERYIVILMMVVFYFGYLLRRYVLSMLKGLKGTRRPVKSSRTAHIPSPLKAKILRHSSISALSDDQNQIDQHLHRQQQLQQQQLQHQQQQLRQTPPQSPSLRHRNNTQHHHSPLTNTLSVPPLSPRHQRRVSTGSTASDSPLTPLPPRTPPVRHFKYYNSSSGGVRRSNRYRKDLFDGRGGPVEDRSDSDANNQAENSDYLSDAINPNLMPMPSSSSPKSRQQRDFIAIHSEDGIPISTTNHTFTFPSRNPSATTPPTTYSPQSQPIPAISVSISPSLPPSMARDRSISSLKQSATQTGEESGADQKSFKSGISKTTSVSTTHREFEQVVKLKDEDDSESSETKASSVPTASTGGVSFWRRSFSRPSSIHELQDLTGSTASNNGAGSGSSATGSGLLPKLSLFKRRSNSDLVGAVAAGITSISTSNNGVTPGGSVSPIAASSPVASVMKSFWPMKSSASSAANRGTDTDPLIRTREDSDSSNRIDFVASVSVPTLGLPRATGKKDKKKNSAASAEKSVVVEKVKEPSRFWPSSSPSKSKGKSPAKSPVVASAALSPPQVKSAAETRSIGSNNGEGGSGSIASSNTGNSASKSFWGGKQKTPAISYAKAVAKADGSSGGTGAKVAAVSVNVDDDSHNWLDVDDHSRSSGQSNSWDRNVLSRFKSGLKSKNGNFLKSFNNNNDSRSLSPSTNTTSSKFFGLRKRASHETMKSEFLRMASAPVSNEHIYNDQDDYNHHEFLDTHNSIPDTPSVYNGLAPRFLISDFDNIDLQPVANMYPLKTARYHYDQYAQPQSRHSNSPVTPISATNRLYESDDGISFSDFGRSRKPTVEPIHRPNSTKTRSIASAPGSNLKRSGSVISLNESTLTTETPPVVKGGENTLYSPFFSGLEIPMTQRPTGSMSSASSSLHLDSSSSIVGSSKSHKSKHHHYHHHHHFYHVVEGGPGGGPVNLPLVNVQSQSEELAGSFRRLRKLSHDAGLYSSGSGVTVQQQGQGDEYSRGGERFLEVGGHGVSKLGGRASGSTIGSFVTVADEEEVEE
ncbi:UNVERIFIED_CONTAM: hypothetical protein HDU68_012783 [Siphonaria sp. JEL0065]|nr:hypothetical protein HDU68_012783 [Siphonaria sp. JEL0065]